MYTIEQIREEWKALKAYASNADRIYLIEGLEDMQERLLTNEELQLVDIVIEESKKKY